MGFVVVRAVSDARRQRFAVHCCALDRECREVMRPIGGAPWRVEVNTRWWHFGIALTPESRYARVDGNDWYFFRKWTRKRE